MSYVLLSDGSITETNIALSGDNDVFVKISSGDTNTDYLENKVSAGLGISITKINTGADESLEIENTIRDASAMTYTPTDNTDWDSSIDPGDVDQALDQLASRVKTLETTGGPSPDASAITFTPSVLANWNSSADPGDVDDALNQLANRVKTLETATISSNDVTFTPSVLGNWNSSADPGDVNDALDQLADRVKDLESSGVAPVVAISATDTTPDYLMAKLVAGSRVTITRLNAGADEDLQITADIQDASIITYTPADNTKWNSNADPGDVDQALDQLASRVKTIETTFGSNPDASVITYTPTTVADWNSSADPGDVDNALDQLAGRVKVLEIATIDASAVTYTPLANGNWNGNTDPGDVNDALDQLAARIAAAETVDASEITYAAADNNDWNGGVNPSDVEDALDQLADRKIYVSGNDTTFNYLENKLAAGSRITIATINEGANEQVQITADAQDASILTYTPSVTADWNSSIDPGDVDQALDQLAERVKDLEAVAGSATQFDGFIIQNTVIDEPVTVPSGHQMIFVSGYTIVTGGSLTINGNVYVLTP